MEKTETNNNNSDILINKWLNKINIKPISSKIVCLNEYALYNLVDLFYESRNEKCKKYKVIKKNEKTFLEIYDNDLLDLFYKKKVNSDWTYVKHSYYEIRFDITIYLFQEKSYKIKRKSKNKSKTTTTNIKISKTNLSDFFNSDSDSD